MENTNFEDLQVRLKWTEINQRELRSLELRAYGALLTAFRAAGDLDEEKRDTLGIVRQSLKISEARHKVEVRRVATQPRLCLIADAVNGFNTIQDWRDEGFVELPSEKPVSRLPSRAYRIPGKLKEGKQLQVLQSERPLRFTSHVAHKKKDGESFSVRPKKSIKTIKDFAPITKATINGWASNDEEDAETKTDKKPNIFTTSENYQSLKPKVTRKKLGSATSSDSESSTEISIESLKRKGLIKFNRTSSKNPLKTLKKQSPQQQQIMRQKSPLKLLPRVQHSPDIIDAPVSPPKKPLYSENSHLLQVTRPRGPKRKISLGSPISGRANLKIDRNNSKSSFSPSATGTVAKRFKKMQQHYLDDEDDELLPPSSKSPNSNKLKVKMRRKRTNLHPSELPRNIEAGIYSPFIEGAGGEEEEYEDPVLFRANMILSRSNLTGRGRGRGLTRRGRGGPRGGLTRFERGTSSGRGRGGGRGRGKLGSKGVSSRGNKLKQPQRTMKPKIQQSKRKQLDEVRQEFMDDGESDKDDRKGIHDLDLEQERMIRSKPLSNKYDIDLDLDAQEEEEEKKKLEMKLAARRTSSPDIVTNDHRRVDRKGGPTDKYNNNSDKYENYEHVAKTNADDAGDDDEDDEDDGGGGNGRRRRRRRKLKDGSPLRKVHKNNSSDEDEHEFNHNKGMMRDASVDKSDAENSNSSSQSSATSQQQKQHLNMFPSSLHKRENSPQPSIGDKTKLLTPPKARNPLPAPVFSTSLNMHSFNKKRAKILNSNFSPGGDFDAAAAASSTTASSLARRTPTLFSGASSSASTTTGAAAVGSGVLAGSKPPAILPQRKAQPHILVNSKAQRNLANTLNAASSSGVAAAASVTGTGTETTTTNVTGVQLVANQHQGSLDGRITGISGLGVGGTNVVSLSSTGQPNNTGSYNLPISSIQNFPTSTLSMTNAIPIGPVRTSQGANIIFLQKTCGTSSAGSTTVVSSGGIASSVGSATGVMTGGSVSMQHVPGKPGPRAVILRRANLPRQGNLMIVDMHKNQVVNTNQVPQFLQTARILNSPADIALLANIQNQGGTVRKIMSGAQVSTTPSLSSAASSSIMSPSIIVTSSGSPRLNVVNSVSISNQGTTYPVRLPINQMNIQQNIQEHQQHDGKRVSRIFSPGEVKTVIRLSNMPKSVVSLQQQQQQQQKLSVVPPVLSEISTTFVPVASNEEEITDSSTNVTPVVADIAATPVVADVIVEPSIVERNERTEPGQVLAMENDVAYYEETVMTSSNTVSANSDVIDPIPDSLTFPSPVKLPSIPIVVSNTNSEGVPTTSLLANDNIVDSEITESSLNLFKSCMNDTDFNLDSVIL